MNSAGRIRREKMTVNPKPAATVVLMDDMSRIYLTKRPVTMKFLSGYYVFPGGTVDKDDYIQECEFSLNEKRDVSFDHAFYVAAARELFEEVGVLLCVNNEGSSVRMNEETEITYRRQLINREISFVSMLKKEGLYLNIDALTYFGHLTSPKKSPIRFDTRFFLTQLPKDQSPKPDLYEIEKAFWFDPDEALSAFQSGKISLAAPTVLALKTIKNHVNGSLLMMPEI